MLKLFFKRKVSFLTSISIIILLIFILGVYLPLTRTFYQQDEWLGYGNYLANGIKFIFSNTSGVLPLVLAQGRVLSNVFFYIFVKYFPLNIAPFVFFAVIFHSLNTILVFLLSKKLFKKSLPAFLGSLFFAVSSVSQGSITWPATSINTLPSTSLVLVAIYFFFKYLDNFKQKWLGLSFLLIYVSLFFKETGIFLFLLLPLFPLFYKKQKFVQFLKTYWYFFAATFAIVAYRILGFKSVSGQDALFLTGSSKYFFDSITVRAILYPLTSFSLSVVPPDAFLNFARYITNVYYPFIPEGQFILVAQTVVLDLLATILSMIIAFVSLALLKITDSKIRKTIIFWFIFLLASFLPYVIISKSYSYLESRYYYLASVAWGVIFAWILSLVIEKIKFKFIKAAFLAIFILFLYVHANVTARDVGKLVIESQTRISILNQILAIKPRLDDDKNIFYVTGDTDYYLPGNKIPFQQGFGYTLMSLYYNSGKIPKELLSGGYLFEIGSEGYKEVGGFGFGYFSDEKAVEIQLKRYKIPPGSIFRFYYDSKNGKLTEINDKAY